MDGGDSVGIGDSGLSISDADLMMDSPGPVVLNPNRGTKKGARAAKKQSNAPKRFKSSFIFFSMAKHKAIKEKLAKEGGTGKTTNITKMVSDAWRNMGANERAKYDAMAREDKARYELEKASYTAPPGVASAKKQRDPNAPKRPMSAFLAFANSRRGAVKAQNQDCSNGEISKILSRMWKDAPDSVKQKYRDDEAALWAAYKSGMVEWRKKNDGRKKASKAVPAGAPAKKRRKRKAKESEEMPSLAENTFVDHQLPGMPGQNSAGNPNQDEMMAASALRGVRGGPNFPGQGGGIPPGGGTVDGIGQQQQQQQYQQTQPGGPGGYGSIFGVNTMNPYMAGGPNTSSNAATQGSFQQDSNTNRALLEMGFPYQQYGGYPLGNSLGNSQAMLMAQALRGGPGPYHNQLLGLSDQQPPLSQLASLAGSQNGQGPGPQGAPPGQNPGLSFMNDNSTGSMSRVGMGDHGLGNGLSGTDRF